MLIIPDTALPGDRIIMNDGEGASRPLIVHGSLHAGRRIVVDYNHKPKLNHLRRNTNEERWRVSMEWNNRMAKKAGRLIKHTMKMFSCGTCDSTEVCSVK